MRLQLHRPKTERNTSTCTHCTTVFIHLCSKRLISTIWGFLSPWTRWTLQWITLWLYDHFHIVRMNCAKRGEIKNFPFKWERKKNWDVLIHCIGNQFNIVFPYCLSCTMTFNLYKTAGQNRQCSFFRCFIRWQTKKLVICSQSLLLIVTQS